MWRISFKSAYDIKPVGIHSNTVDRTGSALLEQSVGWSFREALPLLIGIFDLSLSPGGSVCEL
jgi:hypothetical protein